MADTFYLSEQGNPSHDENSTLLKIALNRALRAQSNVSADCLSIRGMSGVRYRMLINNLIGLLHKPRYLEVGSWAGSTACSAMDGNEADVVCIDNWSEFGGPKDQFFANTNRFIDQNINFKFIESDFRAVDLSAEGKFDVYLFDGPHEEKDQYDGLHLMHSALKDDIIFIVDDWNWEKVRLGTLKAIRDTGYRINFAIDIRTTLDDTHAAVHGENGDWHNGYFLSSISRTVPTY